MSKVLLPLLILLLAGWVILGTKWFGRTYCNAIALHTQLPADEDRAIYKSGRISEESFSVDEGPQSRYSSDETAIPAGADAGDFRALNIYYGTSWSSIENSPELSAYMTELKVFLRNQSSCVIRLTGYTDNNGSLSANLNLSEKRAGEVKDLLVQSGFKASKIVVRAKGAANPIASNETKEGQHRNRRVEVRVVCR